MILLYHSVIPDDSPVERVCIGQALLQSDFERQIQWLSKHFVIVPLSDYLMREQSPVRSKHIAITFDDGYKASFQCIYSFLASTDIPITIFVSTGHLNGGDLLWFSYLKALCFENLYKSLEVDQYVLPLMTIAQRKNAWDTLRFLAKTSGNPSSFCKSISEAYPLSPELFALYAGMTQDQLKVAEKCRTIELGAHTITHPFLDQMSSEEQKKEIIGSKRKLAKLINKPIRYFAYPGGEYSYETVKLVKAAGYEAAFAVKPKKLCLNPQFEIERIGIYSGSLIKLQIKVLGLANLARKLGLPLG
jgi:peptidoglycan/xylan/chitin deacetylase (PgdA/CDA1 family)